MATIKATHFSCLCEKAVPSGKALAKGVCVHRDFPEDLSTVRSSPHASEERIGSTFFTALWSMKSSRSKK